MSFWDVVWLTFITFAFVAYLMCLFHIFTDLFRDRSTSGWVKAVWVVALVVVPLLTALIYLVARGHGMQERAEAQAASMRAQQDAYIRQVAGTKTSPTDQIAQARSLLDAGAISQSEYDDIKALALNGSAPMRTR